MHFQGEDSIVYHSNNHPLNTLICQTLLFSFISWSESSVCVFWLVLPRLPFSIARVACRGVTPHAHDIFGGSGGMLTRPAWLAHTEGSDLGWHQSAPLLCADACGWLGGASPHSAFNPFLKQIVKILILSTPWALFIWEQENVKTIDSYR